MNETLDQMYADFTTKLLPSIQEGLSISKDYFLDLFGRYIKYLIVTDSISLVSYLGFVIFCAVMTVKLKNKFIAVWNTPGYDDMPYSKSNSLDGQLAAIGMGMALCFIGLIAGIAATVNSAQLLAKDIFIPEMRIYEQIQSMRNSTNNHGN